MYDESSMDHPTPVPHATNSSVQSSPLPILPGRGGNGIVGDGQNMMTLREQENVWSLVLNPCRPLQRNFELTMNLLFH
jgi:hypothetical protein